MSTNTPNITNLQFRTILPEFADTAKWPDPLITQYIAQATLQLNTNAWADMLTLGTAWYTAHFMVLWRRMQSENDAGGVPGEAGGLVASKSVGGVSKTYDTTTASELNGGHWNQTTYGKMFLNFARMAGAGGSIVGVGCIPPFSGPPWPGPINPGS